MRTENKFCQSKILGGKPPPRSSLLAAVGLCWARAAAGSSATPSAGCCAAPVLSAVEGQRPAAGSYNVGWPFAKIGSNCLPVETWNPAKDGAETMFQYIDIGSIDQDQKRVTSTTVVTGATAPSRARQLVRDQDVLVSTVRPNLNSVAKLTAVVPETTASTGFCVLRPDPETLDSNYLFAWVRSPLFVNSLMKKIAGANYPAVSQSDVRSEEIPLPPLDDQMRIAHLLGKVEGLIAQRKQHLQQLDALLKSVFLEMFGDPIKNEKGWDRTTIGKIIKVASGIGLTSKEMNSNGNYKVYGGNGVNGVHTEFMFDAPTLVIGRVGYYCGSVHITKPKSWVTDNALFVKEFLKKTDLVFLKHLLSIHDLNKVAGRAAQPLVSGSRIYPIATIDVPFENQTAFSVISEKVEGIKSRYQQSLDELEALYGALSQKAFAGELELSRVPISAIEPLPPPMQELSVESSLRREEKTPPVPANISIDEPNQPATIIEQFFHKYLENLPAGAFFSPESCVESCKDILINHDELTTWGSVENDQFRDWLFAELEGKRIIQESETDPDKSSQQRIVLRKAP